MQTPSADPWRTLDINLTLTHTFPADSDLAGLWATLSRTALEPALAVEEAGMQQMGMRGMGMEGMEAFAQSCAVFAIIRANAPIPVPDVTSEGEALSAGDRSVWDLDNDAREERETREAMRLSAADYAPSLARSPPVPPGHPSLPQFIPNPIPQQQRQPQILGAGPSTGAESEDDAEDMYDLDGMRARWSIDEDSEEDDPQYWRPISIPQAISPAEINAQLHASHPFASASRSTAVRGATFAASSFPASYTPASFFLAGSSPPPIPSPTPSPPPHACSPNLAIGLIYLTLAAHTAAPAGSANFGIALAPSARGKGWGAQATACVLRCAFEDLGVHRVSASIVAAAGDKGVKGRRMEENAMEWDGGWGALRMLTRAGFGVEGVQRRAAYVYGGWRDVRSLAMLATEWVVRPPLTIGGATTLWEEMFERHSRERDELLRWEEIAERGRADVAEKGKGKKRSASVETVRRVPIAASDPGDPFVSNEEPSFTQEKGESPGKKRRLSDASSSYSSAHSESSGTESWAEDMEVEESGSDWESCGPPASEGPWDSESESGSASGFDSLGSSTDEEEEEDEGL